MAKRYTNTRYLEKIIYSEINKNDLKRIYGWALKELLKEWEHYAYKNQMELTRTQLYRFNKLNVLIEELKRRTNDEITGKLTMVTNQTNQTISTNEFTLFTDQQAEAIVKADFHGATYSARIWKNLDAIRDRIEKDMIRLVIGGENPQRLERALRKDFNVGYMEANRLMRTESSRVFNTATLNTYLAEGVTKFGILVTDDERLCETCSKFIDQEYTIETLPTLPDHPNCRCCYVALD